MRIIGAHPVDASEPCHLIEVEFQQTSEIDWSEFTQELPDQDRDNWQVPYDETPLNDDETRWAFFFHYLDLRKPLLTPDGPMGLPSPTPLPKHLESIEYDAP